MIGMDISLELHWLLTRFRPPIPTVIPPVQSALIPSGSFLRSIPLPPPRQLYCAFEYVSTYLVSVSSMVQKR